MREPFWKQIFAATGQQARIDWTNSVQEHLCGVYTEDAHLFAIAMAFAVQMPFDSDRAYRNFVIKQLGCVKRALSVINKDAQLDEQSRIIEETASLIKKMMVCFYLQKKYEEFEKICQSAENLLEVLRITSKTPEMYICELALKAIRCSESQPIDFVIYSVNATLKHLTHYGAGDKCKLNLIEAIVSARTL